MRNAYAVYNGLAPMVGPKGMPIQLDLTAVQSITMDFLQEEMNGVLQNIQMIYVDNAANAQPIFFQFNGLFQKLRVGIGRQGLYPIFATDQLSMTVTTTGGVIVPVILFNVPLPVMEWGP